MKPFNLNNDFTACEIMFTMHNKITFLLKMEDGKLSFVKMGGMFPYLHSLSYCYVCAVHSVSQAAQAH